MAVEQENDEAANFGYRMFRTLCHSHIVVGQRHSQFMDDNILNLRDIIIPDE